LLRKQYDVQQEYDLLKTILESSSRSYSVTENISITNRASSSKDPGLRSSNLVGAAYIAWATSRFIRVKKPHKRLCLTTHLELEKVMSKKFADESSENLSRMVPDLRMTI
jgi:hypothetical protein